MPAISPRLGEFLIRTTGASGINSAFQKVFAEYLDLKLKTLQQTIDSLQKKHRMGFSAFKKKLKTSSTGEDCYLFGIESDFWTWEEAETLKKHYRALKKQWM